ncbi:MAG: nucleotidyl transferase AbiEii/AbiGii toxin family protein [Phycisphaerales bacterium]|nr:nucleotidyl transferase AbiEii/AbiGii toxin family protein [Phycisphaerales bacterium]
MPLFNQLQAKIASVLDELQVPYMMIGGVATIAYTKPRFTEDVDLTIGVSMFDANPVIAALAKAGIKARTGHSSEMMRDSSLLLAVDRASGVTIDISFSDSPYEKEAMSRAKKVRRAGKDGANRHSRGPDYSQNDCSPTTGFAGYRRHSSTPAET